jgi:MoxR-like ATPase
MMERELAPAAGRPATTSSSSARTAHLVIENLKTVIHAPEETLQLSVYCLLCEGHLIIEDFPGVGKTTLAKALARSVGCEFSRLQFTPDLLPSDVTGVNVFNQRTNEFEFRRGPVFTNLLLVDEINRASPKTQAALLECMQEHQVTVDGVSYQLGRPFMVLATQNPIEYEGTYPLPEAELDRFTMRISIGYPQLAEEARMLTEQTVQMPLETLEPVVSRDEVQQAIEDAREVFVEESLNRYIVALLRHTRSDPRLYLGASPRAGIALLKSARARALIRGRRYVIPDDLYALAPDVILHRVRLNYEALADGKRGDDVLQEILHDLARGKGQEARQSAGHR